MRKPSEKTVKTIKKIATIVVGFSAAFTARTVIDANTPDENTAFQDATLAVGSFALGIAASYAATDAVDRWVDDLIENTFDGKPKAYTSL